MKFTDQNEDEGYLDLINQIKEEIEMLKKHHNPTSGIDEENPLLFHNSPKNENS